MSRRLLYLNGDFFPEKAAEHMKKYINEKNLTHEKMSEQCYGVDRRIISSIACGKAKNYNKDTFQKIAEGTGINADYWMGLTDCDNQKDYEEEKKKKLQLAAGAEAMAELEKRIEKEHRQKVQNLKTFFSLCGYRYDCSENYAYVDAPHKLVSYIDVGNAPHELSDTELESLMSVLSDTIGYTLYKKSKRDWEYERQ